MVFCHGCGKQIHESAASCPQCGAVQSVAKTTGPRNYHWSSITSFVTGILVTLMAMTESSGAWDSDAVVGGVALSSVPIIFGVISLSKFSGGRWMAITGLVLGILVLFASIGSMQ